MTLSLGVDIGGTSIKIGLVGENGTIVARRRLRTVVNEPPGAMLERIAHTGLKLTKNRPLQSLGVGIAGLVDHKDGFVFTSPNLPNWERVPVKDLLSRLIRVPVFCTNDANVVALGEWKFGIAQGYRNVVCITLGTGVGTGIIADNQLLLGEKGYAGELGHTIIFPKGLACPCGNRGCLERYVGARAITDRCRRLLRHQKRRIVTTSNQLTLFGERSENLSLLFDLINYDYRRLTPREIGIAARRGDKIALQTIEMTGRLLGLGIYNAVMLLDPELIVLGGGVSRLGRPLLRAVEKAVNHRLYGANRRLKIVLSRLGDDAGIIGAAHLFNLLPPKS